MSDLRAASGRTLVETYLQAAWPDASPQAIRLGRKIVLEIMRDAAKTGPEMYWKGAIKLLLRATCVAIAHRPPGERDLLATLRRIAVAMVLAHRAPP